jgi:hypothetical protein
MIGVLEFLKTRYRLPMKEAEIPKIAAIKLARPAEGSSATESRKLNTAK